MVCGFLIFFLLNLPETKKCSDLWSTEIWINFNVVKFLSVKSHIILVYLATVGGMYDISTSVNTFRHNKLINLKLSILYKFLSSLTL